MKVLKVMTIEVLVISSIFLSGMCKLVSSSKHIYISDYSLLYNLTSTMLQPNGSDKTDTV